MQLSLFFFSWTVLLMLFSFSSLSIFKWQLPCNLKMIKIYVFYNTRSCKMPELCLLIKLHLDCSSWPGKYLLCIYHLSFAHGCQKMCSFCLGGVKLQSRDSVQGLKRLLCIIWHWFPGQISPANWCVYFSPSAGFKEAWKESPPHLVLIESESHFMWLCGFGWTLLAGSTQLFANVCVMQNHYNCWNTDAASDTIWYSSSGLESIRVSLCVVLVTVPVSNMWWNFGTVKWCFKFPYSCICS